MAADHESFDLRPSTLGLYLAVGLAAAVGAGALIWLFWEHGGLPDAPAVGALAGPARHGGLKAFAALAGPAAVFLPSLVLVVICFLVPAGARRRCEETVQRALKLDAASYLALPALALLPLVWRELGAGFTALGMLYLGLVAAKAALLAWVLWRTMLSDGVREGARLDWRGHLAVWLVAACLCGLVAAWSNQAISTASDEVPYLILTHSLVHHGTLDFTPTVAAGEQDQFYWGRWSRLLAQEMHILRAWIFPFVLAPAYFLIGRLGVLLFFGALAGLLAGQLLAWLEECGLKPGPAAAATGLTLTAAPVFFLTQQVFPDLPAMLLLVLALRVLMRIPRRPWLGLAGALALAAALVLLKFRFLPLGLGVMAAAAFETARARWGLRPTLLATAGAVLAVVLVAALWPLAAWPDRLRLPIELALGQWQRAEAWWQPFSIVAGGIGLDMAYGVLVSAPVLVFILAGLPLGLAQRTRPALLILVPAAFYLGAIVFTRWFQWYGGFAPPGRFVAVILPGLALFLGLGLGGLGRPWWRLGVLAPAGLGLGVTALASLAPQMRYARPIGLSPLVEALQDGLGVEIHHLLPSTFTVSPLFEAWAVLALALAAGAAWLAWRRRGAEAWHRPLMANEVYAALLAVGLFLAGLVAAGHAFPPAYLEAEQMRREGAFLWAEYAYPDNPHGAVLVDGKSLSGRLHFPGGPARLAIKGRPDADGELVLTVAGKEEVLPWKKGQAWLEADLGAVPRGYQGVRLTWRSCPDRGCPLLIDRLERRPGA